MRKCKGTGKAKGEEGCGKEATHYRFGLCLNDCFPKWLHNTEAGQEMIIKASNFGRKKVSRDVKKKANREKRERRFELLTYSQRIGETKKVVQRWVRERDKNEPCISCGTHFANEWHAGHFKKAEVYSQLIFNEFNINRQCNRCNTFLDGNEGNYRIGLVKKIGEEAVKELESATPNKVFKYSNEELKEIIKKYTLCKE